MTDEETSKKEEEGSGQMGPGMFAMMKNCRGSQEAPSCCGDMMDTMKSNTCWPPKTKHPQTEKGKK